MTFPLLPSFDVGLAFAVVSGFGFGFVLERAGFGRAQKLVGQFYGYDMSVFKVMFTAVVTAMVALVAASALGLAEFRAIADHAASETLLVPFAIGGFVVGMGFVMSGYCPGTSWVAMASGKLDGLFTVVGSIVGGLVWSELEWRPGFSAFHGMTNLGNLYLWQLLGLPDGAGPAILAVAVVAMAGACFLGAEKVERLLAARADPLARAAPGGRPRRLVLAGLGAAGLAALVGLALPSGTRARAREIGAISPADLARRVFDEPWSVRVLDLRPVAECAARRIPGAECVPEAELPKLALAESDPGRTVVLVGAVDLAAAPPAAAGFRGKLAALQGGWSAWERYALADPPPLAAEASAAERDAFRVRAGIQSALTGMKAPPPPAPVAAPAAGGAKKKGGGCSG
jgi:uncharacterized membrane protein YedE/YeeE/rhodanese-related sulfurtransferase